MDNRIYEFGGFTLDRDEQRLYHQGEIVPLQPKVFDLLVYFVENHGELISRDDLMNAVWAETFVEETNLRFCIHSLRKALGNTADGTDLIETVPKRGYRFTAKVSAKPSEESPESEKEGEIGSSKGAAERRTGRRNWYISAIVVIFACLALLALAWQGTTPKDALGAGKIAVLPFEFAAEGERQMQAGLQVSITNNLDKIKQLNVLPFAPDSGLAGEGYDPLEAGKQLGADAVLTGNYRFSEEGISVSARLVRTSDGAALWSEDFDAQGKSNGERERSAAVRLARLLSLKIAEAEDVRNLEGTNLKEEAVRDYVLARKIWRQNELFRRDEMFGLYEEVIALEPKWALGYASYAEALLSPEEFAEEEVKIEQIAGKAVELDKSLSQPHAVLGESRRWFDWNWKDAETQLKLAISLDPDYALSHYKYSRLLMVQRRFAEAEIELEKAIELEPFTPRFYSGLCELYTSDQKFEDAISACLYAKMIEPDHWQVRKLLFWLYIRKEMYEELDELLFSKLSPSEKAGSSLASALAKRDLGQYWRDTIDKPVTMEQPVGQATFYLQLGEREKALEYLERGLETRDPSLPMTNADPAFDPIRNEKRFVEIMRKIGLQD